MWTSDPPGHAGQPHEPLTVPTGPLVGRLVLTYLTLTAAVGCLVVLYLCMRAVMDVGGACGSGGPYEIAVPCPKGIGWMMTTAILGGLAVVAAYALVVSRLPGPHLWPLAWSALFLSLGWNFWDYGLHPPESAGGGDATGWIVCGVIFVLMGGVPLLGLVHRDLARTVFWNEATLPTGEER